MTPPRLPTRDAIQRLAELTERYRDAFGEVQDCLAKAEMGRIPAWVFAIDRLRMDEVNNLSAELGVAEGKRRSLKVAMRALIEFIALEDAGEDALGDASNEEVADMMSAIEDEEAESARKLDRFITVVNYAKAGGCLFLNGTFEPVVRSASTLPPPPRTRKPIPTPVPKAEGMALPEPDAQISAIPKS